MGVDGKKMNRWRGARAEGGVVPTSEVSLLFYKTCPSVARRAPLLHKTILLDIIILELRAKRRPVRP